MKLTKQETELLLSKPIDFVVIAYIQADPTASVRAVARACEIPPARAYALIKRYKDDSENAPTKNSKKNSKKNTQKNSGETINKGYERGVKNSEKNSEKNTPKNSKDAPSVAGLQGQSVQPPTAPRPSNEHSELVKSLQVPFRGVWDSYYKQVTGFPYQWDGKAIGAISHLIKKVLADMQAGGVIISPEEAVLSFEAFLSIITDAWILNNLSPAIVNSKYNEIKATYARNNTQQQHRHGFSGETELQAFKRAIKSRTI